jgi:CRISPR-associated exonuclease Cas4
MEKRLINVTDLSSYTYCPRKFFLTRVMGLKEPPNKAMISGRIKHEAREIFSNNEKNLIISFASVLLKKQIEDSFKSLLEEIINHVLKKESELISQFSLSQKELKSQIQVSMEQEILLRAESIENTMKQGHFSRELWEHLSPKYVSELSIASESLGLKGRIDRVSISEEIVPFELKTRASETIYPSDEIQLTAYAMLLEEKFNKPVPKGILEAGNKKQELIISQASKQKVLDLIKEIQSLYEQKSAKFPSNFSKCQTCAWEKECGEL